MHEIRYALRALRKSPGFTCLSVFTLALGVGMTTAIFSVVYGVLLRPLRYDRPEQLVDLHEVNAAGRRMRFADPNFDDIRSQVASLDGLAEYNAVVEPVAGGREPTRTQVSAVSRDFFAVLRVAPVLGRGFREADQRRGAPAVAVVGYGFWKQVLGGTTDLTSVRLTLGNRAVSVVGVLPPEFSFPASTEIWLPREIDPPSTSRTSHNWSVIGRLRDGRSVSAARAEAQTIAARLKRQFGQDTLMVGVAVAPLRDAMTGGVSRALWILLGAVGLLLLIACANVANLLLVQSAARRHELAIRAALGGSRLRIVRQLLAETLLLAGIGGALGVLTAFWGVRTLLALSPDVLPRMEDVSISLPVLAFSMGICAVVAVALGSFTGLRSSADLQHALAGGGRSQAGAFVSQRTSRAIVAAQLAVTLTLLTGAALLARSFVNVLSIRPGFRTDRVLTMNLAMSASSGVDKVRRVQFLDELIARVGAVPGVIQVGGTSNLPLTGFHPDGTYLLMNPGDRPPADLPALLRLFRDRSRTGDADYAAVGGDYFRVLGIPLVAGRVFDARDTIDAPHVAVVSASLARDKWPGEDPLGRQIEFGNMDDDLRPLTVVGVVGDVREESLERPAFPVVYVNYRQRGDGTQSTGAFNLVIRTAAEPTAVVSAAREILRGLDPNMPPKFATLSELASGSVHGRRFDAVLLGVFAASALLLAVAGMYGVMAYSVARRTNEFGVRIALGATRATILRAVLEQGLVTAAAGVALGLAASLAVTRSMASLLFGLDPVDPVSYAGVALLLMAIALAASYVPARRATRVDPMVALRYE